jgi:hypothetical protein
MCVSRIFTSFGCGSTVVILDFLGLPLFWVGFRNPVILPVNFQEVVDTPNYFFSIERFVEDNLRSTLDHFLDI